MASKQPAVSDTPATTDRVHPASPASAEPLDLPENPDHHRVPWSVSMPRPYVPHLDRSDFPFLDIRINTDHWDLPPIPFGFHDAPWSGDDASGLQHSSISYPGIYPIFVDSGAATPLYESSGTHDAESDQNWDPINMVLDAYGDHFYDGLGLLLEVQGQNEQRDHPLIDVS
jgi:hypothetical protein